MRLEFPESAHAETLVAVVLGALLATVSGIIANQLEAYLRRRERERSAALLFGAVLSTLRVLLESADRVRRIPPAFGPVTRGCCGPRAAKSTSMNATVNPWWT